MVTINKDVANEKEDVPLVVQLINTITQQIV
jgi:hypothetical protein